MIYISEYFFSIQGEGKNAGNPSLFLRVGGCNLQCLGFGKYGCDSNYAVDKKYKSNWKQYQNTKILLDDLLKIAPSDDNYDLVVTGGEPTLFYKNSILLEVIEFFISKFFLTFSSHPDSSSLSSISSLNTACILLLCC